MKEQMNHRIRKYFKEVIYHISRYVEIVFSVIILVAIVLGTFPLLHQLTEIPVFEMDQTHFTNFLAQALSLVVGVEFVKMLCKHTADTVVEVLLFAVARQLVVEHYHPWETLIGIVAIAILFAIRKYLLFHEEGRNLPQDKL